MTFIYYILLLIFTSAFINVLAEECNLIENQSHYPQLFRHLFCDYDTSERPVTNYKNATVVSLEIFPSFIQFDESTNSLKFHSWFVFRWIDEFLQWKTGDFHGIDNIIVRSQDLWSPSIYIENTENMDNIRVDVTKNGCKLYDTGEVVCVPEVLSITKCDVDYTYWPFYKPHCNIQLSSWSHSSNGINFDVTETVMLLTRYVPHDEWKFVDISSTYENEKSRYMTHETFPTVNSHFSLQRSRTQMWSICGTPALILAAMTLTTLWLDPKSNERLMIGCMNFICHCLCIRTLHWLLPHFNTIPNILIFYIYSTVLAVLSLILTYLMRRIVNAKSSPPLWISSLASMIMSSKLGRILSLSILDPKTSTRLEEDADDSSILVYKETSEKSSLVEITIILGWLWFISFLLMYIIMFAIYLHVPYTLK